MHPQRLMAAELVESLGAHPARALGLDLDATHDADVGRWLVACLLFGGRTNEDVAVRAYRRLRENALARPDEVAAAGAVAVHRHLEAAGIRKSEAVAALLSRVCGALMRDWAGSCDRLAGDADSLEELAGRLAALGAGFGRSGVLRFLTPLRGRWAVAADLPSSAAATAAATDLGLVGDRDDAEGAPAAIASWLEGETRNEAAPGSVGSPTPRDVEAALERLGRAACLRERRDRCPLEDRCPARPAED